MPRSTTLPSVLLVFAALLGACRTEPSVPPAESDAFTVPEPLASAEPDTSWEIVEPRNRPAPEVEAPLLGGGTFRLAELRGRVVVVNFWATWCLPCREEIPDLVALHEAFAERGLSVVGVAMDEEGAEVVRPFVETMGIPYPTVLGDNTLATAFGGVYGLPTTYMVDREGRIARRFLGLVRMDELRPLVEELTKET